MANFTSFVFISLTVSALGYDGIDLVQTKVSPNITAELVREIVDAAQERIIEGSNATNIVKEAAHAAADAIKKLDEMSDTPADIVMQEEISTASVVISQLMTQAPGRCCWHECGGNNYCQSGSDWCAKSRDECMSWRCNGKWCTDQAERAGSCTGGYICVGKGYEECRMWHGQGCVWGMLKPITPRPTPRPGPTPKPPRPTPRPTPQSSCECTGNHGKAANQEYYPEDIGEYCKAWDWDMDYCQEGGSSFGETWCPTPWCYVDEDCPGAVPGSYLKDVDGPELFYSHEVCGAVDTYTSDVGADAQSWHDFEVEHPADEDDGALLTSRSRVYANHEWEGACSAQFPDGVCPAGQSCVSGACEASAYVLGEPSDVSCPSGYIEIEGHADCMTASYAMGEKPHNYQSFSVDSSPRGCIWNPKQSRIWFNNHPTGAPDLIQSPVCKIQA